MIRRRTIVGVLAAAFLTGCASGPGALTSSGPPTAFSVDALVDHYLFASATAYATDNTELLKQLLAGAAYQAASNEVSQLANQDLHRQRNYGRVGKVVTASPRSGNLVLIVLLDVSSDLVVNDQGGIVRTLFPPERVNVQYEFTTTQSSSLLAQACLLKIVGPSLPTSNAGGRSLPTQSVGLPAGPSGPAYTGSAQAGGLTPHPVSPSPSFVHPACDMLSYPW